MAALMIEAIPTQEQIDEIARSLAPDVVRIRFDEKLDMSGDPAFYFKVILEDGAYEREGLTLARRIRATVEERLDLEDSPRFIYFRYRDRSEQAQMRDPSWE